MAIATLCEGAKTLGHSWPSIQWWFTLSAADQGAWASGLGAFAAALAAVGISVAQFRREKVREARMARAIAPALLGDLGLTKNVLQQVKDDAFKLTHTRIAHHDELNRVLRSISRMRLAAFERFNDMLPRLGEAAPLVIECYATIVRTVELVRDEMREEIATQDLRESVATLAKSVDLLLPRVTGSEAALMRVMGAK